MRGTDFGAVRVDLIRASFAAGAFLSLTVLLISCSGGGTATQPPPPSLPVISSFTATPASIALGQSTTLAWQVADDTSVQLSNVSGTLPTSSSSVVIVPAASTTYTLTAANSAGSVQKTTNVTVTTSTSIAGIQISQVAATTPIAANFLSIGMQVGDTTSMVGTSASNVNPIFEQLLKNLTQYANAPLLIRDLADEQNVGDYTQGNLGAIAQVG
jgi:hypothetical protein